MLTRLREDFYLQCVWYASSTHTNERTYSIKFLIIRRINGPCRRLAVSVYVWCIQRHEDTIRGRKSVCV